MFSGATALLALGIGGRGEKPPVGLGDDSESWCKHRGQFTPVLVVVTEVGGLHYS